MSDGKYIGFVDSDDRIDVNMYKVLYQLCEETKSDISVCQLGREMDGNLINKKEEEFIKEMVILKQWKSYLKVLYIDFP